tara:strand:+ start:2745 stop:4754 length:2010 start_codon:yes stop_codon:yes gene_type:complete
MATEIKLRRGTKAQHDDGSGFTGALGEVTVDTTDDTLRVHDGSLKGGHVIAKLSDVEASDTLAELSDTSITSTAAGHILIHDGSNSFDNKAVSGAITINSSGVTALASGQALTNLGGGSGTTFLRKDGTFATPTDTNTTYSIQDGELSQNNFTDDDHSKLNAIEASADVTDTTNVVAALTAGTNISIAGDGTISSTDTNTTYTVQDGELSQNSFTNDDHSKLNGIEASADVTDTTNVVAALTAGTNIAIAGNGTISATDTNTTYSVQDGELSQNNFTNDDHSKLNGIEASADVTDATNVVAALTAGTNIAIAGNGTISSTDTNTQYTGGTGLTLSGTTFNVDAAQTGITSVGTLSGLTTGATTVNGSLTVNNDVMEVVSTDAGATAKPVLKLTRNSSSPADNDVLGAVEFHGENSAGTDKVYGAMDCVIVDEGTGVSGNHVKGQIRFNVATGALQNGNSLETPAFTIDQTGVYIGNQNGTGNSDVNYYNLYRGQGLQCFDINTTYSTKALFDEPTGNRSIKFPDASGSVVVAGMAGGDINGGGGAGSPKTAWSLADFKASANLLYTHYNASNSNDLVVSVPFVGVDIGSEKYGSRYIFNNTSPAGSEIVIDLDAFTFSGTQYYVTMKYDGGTNATITSASSNLVVAAGGTIELIPVTGGIFLVTGIGYS